MSEWRVTWEVVVLGRLDAAWETMRQNAAIGWMMLTMVEGIVRVEGGIGKLLLDGNRGLKFEDIFAIQIIILVIAVGQDYFLSFLKRFFFPYANGRKA
jgi:NitT/TauT family transport system permease protein